MAKWYQREDGEPWLFPELTRSFKQIFIMQMFAVLTLLGVIWYTFTALVAVTGLAVATLIWCAMISAGIARAHARDVSIRAQQNMNDRRGLASLRHDRLLDRDEMQPPAAPVRDDNTLEMTAEHYGRE